MNTQARSLSVLEVLIRFCYQTNTVFYSPTKKHDSRFPSSVCLRLSYRIEKNSPQLLLTFIKKKRKEKQNNFSLKVQCSMLLCFADDFFSRVMAARDSVHLCEFL